MTDPHRPNSAAYAVSRRLGAQTSAIARRLGELLERLPSLHAQADEDARRFLAAYSQTAASREPFDLAPPDGDAARQSLHPIDRLVRGLALTPFEVDLLLLAALAEEHEGLSAVLRGLHPRGEPRATVGLAAQLFINDPDDRNVLRKTIETGPLTASGALEVTGDCPFFEQSMSLADRLWPALHGLDACPESLSRRSGPVAMKGLEAWFESSDVARALEALKRGEEVTILVTGPSEGVAAERGAALAVRAGLGCIRAFPAAITPQLDRLLALHALVRDEVPVLCMPAPVAPNANAFPAPLAELRGPAVVCVRAGAGELRGARPMLPLEIEPLSPAARRAMWAGALPELRSEAHILAARHAVEPSVAAEAVVDARAAQSLPGSRPRVDDISRSLQARARLRLSSGVKLVRPSATWKQLVLPADRSQQLREGLGRLLHQSRVLDDWGFLEGRPGARGVRMLFAGPPGTGKTLAAEVLAHELGAALLIVDISKVVSKWIGETEKNLAEVFDTAERVRAVLLFDEADALFGARTEVTDAHDRYANLETAYLLTRLERFDGLAILSTNLRQNIDPAFIRRLEFVVEFDEPSLAERLELWRCHLPDRAPLGDDVDLTRLAALYPVVGGVIRNAATAAAFRAASEGVDIGLDHFVGAIRREYQKSGRPFPGAPARASAV